MRTKLAFFILLIFISIIISIIAIGQVEIAPAGFTVPWLQYNVSFIDGALEGRVQWNTEDGTLEYGLPGGTVVLQMGQEHVMRVRNISGDPITNGSIVYVTGATDSRLTVDLADASSFVTFGALGLATETIGHNSNGYITTRGLVRGVNTNGLTPGAPLFLSATVPGAFTTTRPLAPNFTVGIGAVVKAHTSEGSVLSTITFVPRLIGLSDVELALPAVQGQLLRWDTASSTFKLTGVIHNGSVVQASLPAGANGDQIFCSDCNPDATCTGGGTGAMAFYIGAWTCELN